MRYAKTLGLMLLAVFALSAVMVSAASAAEAELLTAGNATSKDNGTATFESTGGGIAVKCTASEGSVKATSNSTGTFSELFKGCTAGGFKCTGAGDATGTIHAGGTVELVAVSSPSLHAVEIFTLGSIVEFTCLGVTTKVLGSVVGKLVNADKEETTKITASLIGSGGKNEITEVNGTPYHLESKTGTAAYVESSQNQNVTATGPEVEVMY